MKVFGERKPSANLWNVCFSFERKLCSVILHYDASNANKSFIFSVLCNPCTEDKEVRTHYETGEKYCVGEYISQFTNVLCITQLTDVILETPENFDTFRSVSFENWLIYCENPSCY